MAGFGAFGKIAALGDFFRLEVPGSFVAPWDDWLQRTILAARQSLGAVWDDCYLSAPIWRFTLAPGLAGPNPAVGVMMPSVDRVGRQFPLTLVKADDPALDPLTAHFRAGALYHDLEVLALETLDELSREALAERLSAISWQDGAAAGVMTVPGALLVCGGDDAGPLPDLAARLLRRDFRAPSLWSTEAEDGPRLMVCEGLPGGAQALGLFDLTASVWQRSRAA